MNLHLEKNISLHLQKNISIHEHKYIILHLHTVNDNLYQAKKTKQHNPNIKLN